MDISAKDHRQAFSIWLRTGRWPVARAPDGVEFKFNPYHDPRNGQFTFAPGGPAVVRSVGYVRSAARRGKPRADARERNPEPSIPGTSETLVPSTNQARPPAPRTAGGRGSNSRAFEDPMMLEQAFPGLRSPSANALLAVADNIFDFKGPASAAQVELLKNWSRETIQEIKAMDPNWHFDSLTSPNPSLQSQIRVFNDLRFQRAFVFLRKRGDVGPLQVETLRLMQRRADIAYEHGLALLEGGRLKPRLSDAEALGNYIDKEVRRDIRSRYDLLGIDWSKGGIRVNGREYDSSGTDLTYRRPDARIGSVAFDVTLTRKTLATAQVRGFFNADFRPTLVVIVRPSQLGNEHTYAITRPEAKQ